MSLIKYIQGINKIGLPIVPWFAAWLSYASYVAVKNFFLHFTVNV
jgi:hypothetical protein